MNERFVLSPGTPRMTSSDIRKCPTTDKMRPLRWKKLPHIRGRFCQMRYQHIIDASVEITEIWFKPSIHHLKLLPQATNQSTVIRQLLKVCQLEPIWEKVTECAPVSPTYFLRGEYLLPEMPQPLPHHASGNQISRSNFCDSWPCTGQKDTGCTGRCPNITLALHTEW